VLEQAQASQQSVAKEVTKQLTELQKALHTAQQEAQAAKLERDAVHEHNQQQYAWMQDGKQVIWECQNGLAAAKAQLAQYDGDLAAAKAQILEDLAAAKAQIKDLMHQIALMQGSPSSAKHQHVRCHPFLRIAGSLRFALSARSHSDQLVKSSGALILCNIPTAPGATFPS
jgi:prophage DNA circulation protein